MDSLISPGPGGRCPRPSERVDEACDRFEAAWRAGPAPRIEDYLAEAEEADHPSLLGELVALERELRRHGERPGAHEYLDRFPGHAGIVRAAFGAQPKSGGGPAARPQGDTGRNLLFGVLALQNNFIGRDNLLAAFAAWVADKGRPLAQLLVDRGALDDARRMLLEALVAEHLKQHGDDPDQSLAALSSLGSVRDDLERFDDADLQASLAAATAAYAPSSRRAGARFRILRFHRQGGLGRVYLARDEELGRDVALKEIRPDMVAAADLRGRFVLEAEINGGLEHPGIVPVYSLGTYDDGRPFYAMRFVEGDSLKEAIESYHKEHPRPDPTAVEFRKLLGRFIDVCEAIAFAHSKGVLHRDLKPHNVMLGRFGETLLIDWGLAKVTGRREPVGPDVAHEATLVPPSGSGHAPTLGVLGSPPYMSPEQAAGAAESLGPATDVYGLGAILFALLTGEPPVEGKTTEEILDRVRRGAIRSPRSLNPSIPRALEAVCLKALAPQPGNRYPTALALAEEVEHWLADEPVSAYREGLSLRLARWARRNRTVVITSAAVLLVALAGTCVVLTMQTRANLVLKRSNDALAKASRGEREANARLMIARDQAQAEFDLAMEAIKTFHTGISEDILLKQKEFDGLRTKLLKGAANFYGKLEILLKGQTDRRSRAALGTAYTDLARLTDLIGSKAEALALHRQALEIRRELAAELGADSKSTLDVAWSLFGIGYLCHETGDALSAQRSYEAAIALVEDLTLRDGVSNTTGQILAVCYDNVGHLQFARDKSGALASYLRAMAICQKLADADPKAIRFQDQLASCNASLGTVQSATGDTPGALKSYYRAMTIRQKLADLAPTNTDYQRDLANSYTNLGDMKSASDDSPGALESHRHALAIRRKLTEDYPTNTLFQGGLANSYADVGHALRATDDTAGALALFLRAMTIYQKLADANPNVPGYQRGLRDTQYTVGLLQRSKGDSAGALKSFNKALAILEELSSSDPNDLYDQACLLALISELSKSCNKSQADGDHSMRILRQAVARGFDDAAHMADDHDLDLLRDRSDFKLLMMDLTFPTDPFWHEAVPRP